MNAERDELLDLHGPLLADIREQDDYAVSAVTSILAYSEGVEHALDTVWAKGYRKPRTVTTTDELDALEDRAVVISATTETYAAVKRMDRKNWWVKTGSSDPHQSSQVTLPALVIHEGALA